MRFNRALLGLITLLGGCQTALVQRFEHELRVRQVRRPLAAVAVSLPDSRFTHDRLPELGRLVAGTAAEITARRLG